MLFFGLCACVLAWKATTNDRGLILNGLIYFSQAGATTFYWVLAALSTVFVAAAIWIVASTLIVGVPDIALTDQAISIPAGFPIKRPLSIPFAEITGLSRSEISGQQFLVLHTKSKKHHIVLNWLASAEIGRELDAEIASRLSQ